MDETVPPQSAAEVGRRGLEVLARSLPAQWKVFSSKLTKKRSESSPEWQIVAPDGTTAVLICEIRKSVVGRDVIQLSDRLSKRVSTVSDAIGVVISRYLAPQVREQLVQAGASYVDLTGNIRIDAQSLRLFISDRGVDRDPWRQAGRPQANLTGVPAAKIVRALVDLDRAWTVRELVKTSGASTGSTYRVMDYLEREGLAQRNSSDRFDIPDWRKLLRRWSDDYGFVRNSRVTRWIQPRGLEALTDRAIKSRANYAFTGTIAAAEWEAYAPARLAMVYVADANEAAARWGLRATEAGANVLLAEPENDVVFTRTQIAKNGLVVAAPAQVVVDLMTGPGRNPSEAEELMEWMVRNESTWRQ